MKSALLVVDVQQSFTRRPYWSQEDLPPFLERMQRLIDRCVAADMPVLQVFHSEESEGPQGAFSRSSGLVRTLPPLEVMPTAVFYKAVHSAMFARDASGVSVDDWLRRHGISRVIVSGIRTEQCCETTARHASDLGYAVTYALDATLTFAMMSGSGRLYTPSEIKERTELVLAGRFAQVVPVEAVALGGAG